MGQSKVKSVPVSQLSVFRPLSGIGGLQDQYK
jgi:hypothetical protein